MATTITGTNTVGVSLTLQSESPVTVAQGAVISTTGTLGALYGVGGSSYSWTIDNSGGIAGGQTGKGVQLGSTTHYVSNAILTNRSYGVITGGVAGASIDNSGTATLTNAGGLINGGQFGVAISGTGTVTNTVGGQILDAGTTGTSGAAIYIYAGQVYNAGSIAGRSGIDGFAGGSVTNVSGGTVVGSTSAGIDLAGSGTVVNGGIVIGKSAGVYLEEGGSISNAAGGTITGGFGVINYGFAGSGGSVTNAGTIIGTTKYAVQFKTGGGSNYRLIVDPGAMFVGTVDVGSGTVELASGGSAGTLYGFGSTITNFSTLQIDSGADWRLAGDLGATPTDNQGTVEVGNSNTLDIGAPISASSGSGIIEAGSSGTISIAAVAVDSNQTFDFADNTGILELAQPSGFQAPIQNFAIGNTIDLTSVTATAASWGSNVLTVTDSGTVVSTLAMPGNYSAFVFGVSPDSGGTGSDVTVTATCYAAGTRILTPRGEVPIERLHRDDLVITVSGRPQPIRWIGHRRVDFRTHPNHQRILPVRIAAHAFGDGRPKRNLLLSPDHAVYVQGVLIPIRHLINGTTIAQIQRRAITYYHIELLQHDVLVADGLPAETYLDAGGRSAFGNGDAVIQLHPEFNAPQDHYAMLWEQHGYAPLVVAGETLERVRVSLAAGSQYAA
jgi:hypothetical protein